MVPKLDRLARSVPDAREIVDALQARGVELALGVSIYDPADPMEKMFFNVLATFAEFARRSDTSANPRRYDERTGEKKTARQTA
ncbi:Resolvase%2C N terminal domain [Yersinia pseudotuberculosis]|uniref:Resolvase, N terminal domain n=1 Tax=Yersinia wautersii TaxID=1341643 RepID=A0ABP1Z7U8_9GAMM|nr:Resolvase%2C N terminal domain [Yersinia pseudotuberculosis]CRG48734.1 Resolvase%2C N terminal domain [Yersinia wautersii]